MAKVGRKKLLKLDIDGRNKFFNEIRRFLNTKLGKKKRYVLIVTYEGEQSTDGSVGVHTQTFANLNANASLALWKVMLVGLMTSVQNFVQQYNLGTGVKQGATVEPKAPDDSKKGD